MGSGSRNNLTTKSMVTLQLTPEDESASTFGGAVIVRLLRRTDVPVPKVRLAALRESCRVAPTSERLLEVVLDALAGSPYVPGEFKSAIAEAVATERWQDLINAEANLSSSSSCGNGESNDEDKEAAIHALKRLRRSSGNQSGRGEAFHEFRELAILVLKSSRKIQGGLNQRRKLALFQAFRRCRDKDSVIAKLLENLNKATTLGETERSLIANDVFEGNYHRLLLPDRFDCDERPRMEEEDEDEDDHEFIFDGASTSDATTDAEASAPLCVDDDDEPVGTTADCPFCLESFIRGGNSRRQFECEHCFCGGCTAGLLEGAPRSRSRFCCPICGAAGRDGKLLYHRHTAAEEPGIEERFFLPGKNYM